MARTVILRTRVDARRKARVEKILGQLGLTANQAVKMLFAQIELRRAIPFPITLTKFSEIVPPLEHVRQTWATLDGEDFSNLIRLK